MRSGYVGWWGWCGGGGGGADGLSLKLVRRSMLEARRS